MTPTPIPEYKNIAEIATAAGALAVTTESAIKILAAMQAYADQEVAKALASQQTIRKYFFSQDDSCHWYMIPVERRDEWEKARDLDLDSDKGYAEWQKGKWEDYMTGGGIGDIEFSVETVISIETPADFADWIQQGYENGGVVRKGDRYLHCEHEDEGYVPANRLFEFYILEQHGPSALSKIAAGAEGEGEIPEEVNAWIENEVERRSFQVPYDGSNKFYDQRIAKECREISLAMWRNKGGILP